MNAALVMKSCWYDEPAREMDFHGMPLLYLHMLFDGLGARIEERLTDELCEDYWPFCWHQSAHRLIDSFGEWVSHDWLENYALLHRVVVEAEMRELHQLLEAAA